MQSFSIVGRLQSRFFALGARIFILDLLGRGRHVTRGRSVRRRCFFVYQSIHFGFVFSKQDVLHSVGNLVKPIYFIANERKRWQMLR